MSSIDDYKAQGFSVNQLNEIEEGLKRGVDVSIYALPEFVSIQMRQIRLGLEEDPGSKKFQSVVFEDRSGYIYQGASIG